MTEVARFQIRYMPFEYEDMPGTFKERPVIVGAVSFEKALVLLVKVTGHGPRREYPGEVVLVDWAAEGLSKPSVARCSKTVEVDLNEMRDAPLAGRLSQRDAEAVDVGMRDAGVIR